MEDMTPLQKAQQVIRDRREAGETIERLNPIEKSIKFPISLRFAIHGTCYDCSNSQRDEIKHCPCSNCTLWHVRPYQSNNDNEVEVSQ